MRCYRLYEKLPGRSALGYGPGAARWNHHGTPIIYAATSISLCFLEMYSIKGPIVAHSEWMLTTLDIPDSFPMLKISSAPKDWNRRPASDSTKDFGTTWAISNRSVCLGVPSARLPRLAYPREYNILLNPLHSGITNLVSGVSTHAVSFALNP